MSDLPGMPSSIRCAACGFENTTTSLYCQDCGMRLVAQPSAIEAAEAEAPIAPARAATVPVRSRPRILSTHRPNRLGSFIKITFLTLVIAAFAALIVQILRPPVDVPPAAIPLSAPIVKNIHAALQRSAQAGAAFDAPWSGGGLNAYLAAVLPPATPGGPLHTAFQRALLAPANDGFTLFVERKVAGLTIYSRIGYRLVSRGNGIGIVPANVAIGRLPLPVIASFAIESISGNLESTLAPELEILRQAKSVRITFEKAAFDFGSSHP